MSAHANRYEQAVDGLGDMPYGGGVVRICDGHTYWLCSEAAFDRAAEELRALPPLEGDEGGAEAYGELCRLTCRRSPIAAVDGGSRHGSTEGQMALIAGALRAGLIDCDLAASMGAQFGARTDPTQDREGISVAEAADVGREDGALIYVLGAPSYRLGECVTLNRDLAGPVTVRECTGYLVVVEWDNGQRATMPVTALAKLREDWRPAAS
jgi:hypothetical protein